MDRIILDLVAATDLNVENNLYAKYKDFSVVELVQENFTLYGKLVLIDSLKPNWRGARPIYKRKAFKYYVEMN